MSQNLWDMEVRHRGDVADGSVCNSSLYAVDDERPNIIPIGPAEIVVVVSL